MNKKGRTQVALLDARVFLGIAFIIIFFIFLSKGGTDIITQITAFLKTIPAWGYVVAGILIFLLFMRGGRRR